jgi:hypothetical protein
MKYQVHLDTSETNGGSSRIVKNMGNPFLASIFLGIVHKNVNTVELKSAEIPIGFYNIRSPYNTFTINGTTYTVPPGNYTLPILLSVLSNLSGFIFDLSGSRITLNLNSSGLLYSMTSPFTFTNMDASGANGPTDITYGASTPGLNTSSVLVLAGGIQYWTVPQTKTYTFTLAGASSFHTASLNPIKIGYGMVMTASRSLVAGQLVAILVGQQGRDNATGAGGTFIAEVSGVGQLAGAVPLFVAGGAAGPGGESGTTNSNIDATLATTGRDGLPGAPTSAGSGGIGPDGGKVATVFAFSYADGGAGFTGDGGFNARNGSVNTASKSFINGGRGGVYVLDIYSTGSAGQGGFGGGGAYGTYQRREGGGGGGYGGGGAGSTNGSGAGGGGGGSYDITGAYSGSATNAGAGYVTISFS